MNVTFVTIFALLFLGFPAKNSSRKSSAPTWNVPVPVSSELTVEGIYGTKYGRCAYVELSIATRGCESTFYRDLILNPQQSCTPLFAALEECKSRKRRYCFGGATNIVNEGVYSEKLKRYSQDFYCNQGALSIPSTRHPVNYCNVDYKRSLRPCFRTFHQLFRNDPKNPKICGEFLRARKCMMDLQDQMCDYGADLEVMQQATRQLYRCWNPFCLWGQYRAPYEWYQDGWNGERGVPKDCARNTASLVDGLMGGDLNQDTSGSVNEFPTKTIAINNQKPKRLWSRDVLLITTPSGCGDVIKPYMVWLASLVVLLIY
nr:uncharacterized protein LOC101242048 [Ciona intestinalis]XP_026694676.1 uncharacterized protein LOC101242048 [Ciona intestinalis]|eukprot:XP_018671514.1 uncharacterized protein LOC101242048 [Ciona intestinalis]